MSKVLLGICTFGLLDFTKLTVKHMMKTIQHPVDYCIVVGKPGDFETIHWVLDNDLNTIIHEENYGFPKGINDLYDFAWKKNNYDYLITLMDLCGLPTPAHVQGKSIRALLADAVALGSSRHHHLSAKQPHRAQRSVSVHPLLRRW